jgi:hypothetical protein
MTPVHDLVLRFMRSNLIGKRVTLLFTSDPYTNLTRGDEGVVDYIDDIGTVFVKWDNGSRLGLVEGEDLWTYN